MKALTNDIRSCASEGTSMIVEDTDVLLELVINKLFAIICRRWMESSVRRSCLSRMTSFKPLKTSYTN